MDIDDDAPPELVEAGHENDEKNDEDKAIKVPITIVTGKSQDVNGEQTIQFVFSILTSQNRLFRSWKDHIAELHFDCPSWQEDCCDYE